MPKFYTITAADTTHCNDRSKRFNTLHEAREAAYQRLTINSETKSIVIMEAVENITRKPVETPFIIQPIN